MANPHPGNYSVESESGDLQQWEGQRKLPGGGPTEAGHLDNPHCPQNFRFSTKSHPGLSTGQIKWLFNCNVRIVSISCLTILSFYFNIKVNKKRVQ